MPAPIAVAVTRASDLSRAVCMDVYVRATDEAGTEYQACADDYDTERAHLTNRTAYGPTPAAALDALATKLGAA